MTGYKPYPQYKPSEIDWLEDIPAHWEATRNFALFSERIERGFTNKELLAITIGRGVIKQTEVEIKQDTSNEDKSNYKLIKVGDLGYNKMRMWQGAVGYSQYEGIVSPAYIILKPRKGIEPRFFHYLFRTPIYTSQSYRNAYGIVDDQHSLRYHQFKAMYSPVPPLAEQTAIADFLDRKTGQIDAYVALKEKAIALLQEQKTAIINAAVTGKLTMDNGQLTMDNSQLSIVNSQLKKGSGIEWLGEVPAHWEVKKLKHIGRVKTGMAKNSSNVTNLQSLVPYLRVANVQDGYLDLTDVATIPASSADIEKYQLQKGDLLMNEGGDFDKLGRGCVWNGEIPICLHQNHVFAVRIKKGINPYWINFLTLTHYGKCYFISKSKQTTNLASISSRNLAEFPALIPPANEANEIMEMIYSATAKIDQAIAQAQQQIDLIKEYRESLISQAVTGKIRVIER